MKLIRMKLNGFSMYRNGLLDLNFYATDRVANGDTSVTLIDKPIYSQNVLVIAGINASGKTTTLKIVKGVLDILIGRPLGAGFTGVLSNYADSQLFLEAVLFHDGKYYLLSSLLERREGTRALYESSWAFSQETLRELPAHLSKKRLNDFELLKQSSKVIQTRSNLSDDALAFLHDDVSIISSLVRKKEQNLPAVLMLDTRDQPLTREAFSLPLLKVFDDSVVSCAARPKNKEEESVFSSHDMMYEIQFSNGQGCIAPGNCSLIGYYLSDGTTKGANILSQAISALQTGGYLLVDEIENHLNKQLVKMIINLFESRSTNPRGAAIVFSTHYPEILDFVKRKDDVYFLSRDEEDKVCVILYSKKVKRIENKKSEVFIANLIQGTAPKYETITNLKKYITTCVESLAL